MRRRAFLTTVGVGVAGGLAGCSSDSPSDGGNNTGTTTSEPEYAVYTTSPMDEVPIDGAPETWVANNGSYADMGLALGVDEPTALWMTSRWHTNYYDGIDGVSPDKSDMISLYQSGVEQERFHERDADIHVMDPNFLLNRFNGWTKEKVADIEENVAPFYGNSIFSRGYPWHADYDYLTLYEAFEKLAGLFERTERYDAFASLHEDVQSELDGVAPTAESDQPRVAVLWATGDEPTSFLPYLVNEGTSFKQWRDLNVRDALAETDVKDFHASRGSIDFETLLDVDPDVLLLRGHESKSASKFESTVVQFMEDHEIGSELTAVENGDVYRGGPLYQGPISNLVLTERGASQLYGYDGQLFDRERVTDIVNGDV